MVAFGQEVFMKIELVIPFISFISLACSLAALRRIGKTDAEQKKLRADLMSVVHTDDVRPREGPPHSLAQRMRENEHALAIVFALLVKKDGCVRATFQRYEMERRANTHEGTLNILIDTPGGGYPWAMGYLVYNEGRPDEQHRRMVIPNQTGWGIYYEHKPYRVSLCFQPEEWQGADSLHLYVYNAPQAEITCGWPEKKESRAEA